MGSRIVFELVTKYNERSMTWKEMLQPWVSPLASCQATASLLAKPVAS